MREHLWTWSGIYFGYRQDDKLWTHSGIHAGKFFDYEVYWPNGQYLGDIKGNRRLITKTSKKSKRKGRFSSSGRKRAIIRQVNYVGNVMYAGYEDFPSPQDFR